MAVAVSHIAAVDVLNVEQLSTPPVYRLRKGLRGIGFDERLIDESVDDEVSRAEGVLIHSRGLRVVIDFARNKHKVGHSGQQIRRYRSCFVN